MTTPFDDPGRGEGEPRVHVRPALDEDALAIRRVVAHTLLASGFDAPTPERDEDLMDLEYYRRPGCAIWVATNAVGEVIGCVAVDRGPDQDDHNLAVLRRLAGDGLDELARTAVDFAQGRSYQGIETVLPPGMEHAREALESLGFAAGGPENKLLLRRAL